MSSICGCAQIRLGGSFFFVSCTLWVRCALFATTGLNGQYNPPTTSITPVNIQGRRELFGCFLYCTDSARLPKARAGNSSRRFPRLTNISPRIAFYSKIDLLSREHFNSMHAQQCAHHSCLSLPLPLSSELAHCLFRLLPRAQASAVGRPKQVGMLLQTTPCRRQY